MEMFRSVTPLVEPLSPRRGLPRRVRGAGAGSGDAAEIGELHPRPGLRRAGHHLLGRGGQHQVRRQARLDPRQARRAARRAAPPRSSTSCTRCRWARCGAWGRRPRRSCVRLGLRTVGDLAQRPARRPCSRALGAGRRLPTCTPCPGGATSAGWSPHEPEKSIGAEETFARRRRRPGRRPPRAAAAVRTHGRPAARRRHGRAARSSIKVRFADFTTITRIPHPARPHRRGPRSSTRPRAGLFDALGLDRARLRLVGVRVEGLVEAETPPRQLRARRPRARPAGGRAGRRPGGPPVRGRRGAPGQPGQRRPPRRP